MVHFNDWFRALDWVKYSTKDSNIFAEQGSIEHMIEDIKHILRKQEKINQQKADYMEEGTLCPLCGTISANNINCTYCNSKF